MRPPSRGPHRPAGRTRAALAALAPAVRDRIHDLPRQLHLVRAREERGRPVHSRGGAARKASGGSAPEGRSRRRKSMRTGSMWSACRRRLFDSERDRTVPRPAGSGAASTFRIERNVIPAGRKRAYRGMAEHEESISRCALGEPLPDSRRYEGDALPIAMCRAPRTKRQVGLGRALSAPRRSHLRDRPWHGRRPRSLPGPYCARTVRTATSSGPSGARARKRLHLLVPDRLRLESRGAAPWP
jgi:hypothetical protein